jgi:hypothetical protein
MFLGWWAGSIAESKKAKPASKDPLRCFCAIRTAVARAIVEKKTSSPEKKRSIRVASC